MHMNIKSNPISISAEIEKYLTLIAREVGFQNLSKETTRSYTSVVKNMLVNLQQDGKNLTRESVSEYVRINIGGNSPLKRNTRAQYVHAIRFFCSYILKWNDLNTILPSIKGEIVLNDIYTEEEVIKIICNTESLEDYTILSILYSTGMRVSEVVNLKVSDIKTKEGRKELLIRQGKGKKDRIVPINNMILELLRAWWKIGLSPVAKKTDNNFLFPTDNIKQSSISKVQQIWLKAKKKAGLNKQNTGLHTLRRCFATHALEKNVSLYSIASIMGHSNIISTTRYLRRTPALLEKERELLGELPIPPQIKKLIQTGHQ